jgi:thiol:disulfide interchange protein
MLRILIALLTFFYSLSSFADVNLDKLYALGATAQEGLPFSADCSLNNDLIRCNLFIKNGSYIYKDSIGFEGSDVLISSDKLPDGIMHEDVSGTNEVYMESVSFNAQVIDGKAGSTVKFSYRGCDSQGICYPSQTQDIFLEKDIKGNIEKLPASNINQEKGIFSGYDNFLIILLLCLCFGVALDLTPCVLPLLSIYSATIMGSKYVSAAHKIKQNISYILGLALTYCVLGLVFAEIGVSAHGILQHPVSIIILSSILLIFTLDCAGFINLKVPLLFNNSLQIAINKQKDGTLAKAFIFGALSALITTPCTSAPLAGALVYIITSNSILKGVLMFLFIGLGMGLPLLVIGFFGSKYISKLKNHTEQIRRLFAIPLFLGAYYICQHLFGDLNRYIEPAVYASCGAYFIGVLFRSKKVSYILMAAFLCFWAIYTAVYTGTSHVTNRNFTLVHKIADLSKYNGKKTLVTFSAEWCANCHELDKTIYASDEFLDLTKDMNRIRFDITDPDTEANKELTKNFNIIGVPFLLVLDEDGKVIRRYTGSPDLEEITALITD